MNFNKKIKKKKLHSVTIYCIPFLYTADPLYGLLSTEILTTVLSFKASKEML